jgi:hypothetical protein
VTVREIKGSDRQLHHPARPPASWPGR